MTYYRKSPGGRRFVKVNGTEIIEVLSGEKFCQVLMCDNGMKACDILENMSLTDITPDEFAAFYAKALTRLSMQRIDV